MVFIMKQLGPYWTEGQTLPAWSPPTTELCNLPGSLLNPNWESGQDPKTRRRKSGERETKVKSWPVDVL